MSVKRKIEENTHCDLTEVPVYQAYGEEVNLFLHIHLRGYDQHGTGEQMHAEYYDKYGAPAKIDNSWLEGYRAVEQEIALHYNECSNPKMPFPLVAACGGGAHLYDVFHQNKPWNWTGWVPKQKKWCCVDRFFCNRSFISLRGNEVQNNLWDYHPFDEEPGHSGWDDKYSQLVPRDKYRGGYFFFNNPWGRYLHIISLKSMVNSPYYPKRYNYIVHPLAYRANVADYPDDSVDAMQWSINNVNSRTLNVVPIAGSKQPSQCFPAFGDDQLEKWGSKNHGIEIFNDFTYYYSSTPLNDGDDWKGGNGYLHNGLKPDYIHWFNSYPHEFGEFLLETCLRQGNYLHALAANDAMYMRNDVEIQHNDPKSPAVSSVNHDFTKQKLSDIKNKHKISDKVLRLNPDEKKARDFLQRMPYQEDTIFGYTALFDPALTLKQNIYGRPPYNNQPDLDQGELDIFDHLIEGRFFAHTGVYDIFNFKNNSDEIQQHCPVMIEHQDPEKFFYDFKPELNDLIFTMPKAKKADPKKPSHKDSIALDIVWQFTVEVHKKDTKSVECHRGYFKLNEDKRTRLDLTKDFDENEIAWIRIQGYDVKNPQRRAWFQAIRGPMFNKISWTSEYGKDTPNPPLTNYVHVMVASTQTNSDGEEFSVYTPSSLFDSTTAVDASKLCFNFNKTTDEHMLCVYNLQVMSIKQSNKIPTAGKKLPPTYLQNICGVFTLSEIYPTKLDLNSSWDSSTVKDDRCDFYMVTKDAALMSMKSVMKK